MIGERLARFARDPPGEAGHWLTRFLILRLLGLVYLMAFLTLVNQGPALIGPRGLEPASTLLDEVTAVEGSRIAGFWALPSIFWCGASDAALRAAGTVGVALAAATLAGFANAITLSILCGLQISIVAVGGSFYGFGWEIQLVETGFLCIFLCPLLDPRPFPRRPPPAAVIWLLRWLIARVMWGAGLIKIRGDSCWRDLTCLDFHFETQPIPSPLTPLFHFLPAWAHKLGVGFNHFVELVAPFMVFGPRRARIFAGCALGALQLVLIASGNLSFLNWLTLVPILACFDDGSWARLFPRVVASRAEQAARRAIASKSQGAAVALLTVIVAVLSVPPILNLLSGRQLMNVSFTRLPLVNTYGAFGTVGRERDELIFEGTRDDPDARDARWLPYEFKCKPGDPGRRPCWMSPYHYRLDWLLWFAAMGEPRAYPWAVRLVERLLEADAATLDLLASDPFDGQRPRAIRVVRYRYALAPRGADRWWNRAEIGEWLPPLTLDEQPAP